MKRSVCLLACILPAAANAAANFVGIGYAQPSITASAGGASATADADSDLTLQLGRTAGDVARYYATAHIVDAGSGVTTDLYSISYDGLFGQGLAKGFVGGTLGYLRYKETGEILGTPYSFEKSGATYGFQLGALFSMNQRTELEIGYHHLLTNLSQDLFGVTVKVERITYFGVGANFRF